VSFAASPRRALRLRVSKLRLIHSRLDLKFWTEGVPELEAVRPARCVSCGAASRCPGRPLTVVGHGLRTRQLRGPLHIGEAPVELMVRFRRFRCRGCGAVMAVVPPELVRYRLYSVVAIVWALALFGLEGISASHVRERVSPWSIVGPTAARSWQTLRRWLEAAGRASLLPLRLPRQGQPRALAAAMAHSLSSRAPPSCRTESIAHQAVSGALHALMGITP